MIFAIIGLRSMYFIISALSRFFVYMDQAVCVVLTFIAAKLIAGATMGLHVDPNVSLVIILAILSIGALSSIIIGEKNEKLN